jgi:hypothetical protein
VILFAKLLVDQGALAVGSLHVLLVLRVSALLRGLLIEKTPIVKTGILIL